MSAQRVAAYSWIEQDGKVLLCRLSEVIKDSMGRWTLPGGGIDYGESPNDAAVREAHEETGYEIALDGVVGVDSRVYRSPRKMHAIRIVYRAHVIGGEIRHELDGTTDMCAWVPKNQIRSDNSVDLVTWTMARVRRRH